MMNGLANLPPVLRFQTFVFRLGGVVATGTFNSIGGIQTLFGHKTVKLADGSVFKARFDPRSQQITGSLTKATVAKVLNNNAITTQGTTRVGFQLIVSNVLLASDTLEFLTRTSGNKLQMDYKLSRAGKPLGGSFQILKAIGRDALTISGTRGDAWSVKFFIIPRFGVDTNPGLDALSSINVRIGQRFVQKINSLQLSSTSGGNITMLKPAVKNGVAKLQIDTKKFVGQLETFGLDTLQTFISPAADVAPPPANVTNFPNAGVPPGSFTNTDFDLGLDFNRNGNNASYTGEYGKLILGLPGKKVWIDNVGAGDRRPQLPANPPPAPAH
jgi:hypothetical protein